jgi:hypothetical protein
MLKYKQALYFILAIIVWVCVGLALWEALQLSQPWFERIKI